MNKTFFLITFCVFLSSLCIKAQNNKNNESDNEIYNDLLNDSLDLFDEFVYDESPNNQLFLLTVENQEKFSDISVYPNLTSLIININIPDSYKYLDINFYNTEGNTVLNRRRTPGLINLDISGFKNGIYYMQLIDPQSKDFKTFRILKK